MRVLVVEDAKDMNRLIVKTLTRATAWTAVTMGKRLWIFWPGRNMTPFYWM